MKKLLFLVAACSALALQSCENDDGQTRVSDRAQEALFAKYPDATNITWRSKGGYVIANFNLPASQASTPEHNVAWFDNAGSWYMTETEIPYSALPEAVRTAFEASEYATWRIDDVDRLDREGAETIYVLEVEGRIDGVETEYDLYYSPDGVLVKTSVDTDSDYGDYIPSPVSGTIEAYIQTNYPGARILDIERERGLTEVEILDGRVHRELYFDGNGNWCYTQTEVRSSEVPKVVMQALADSAYASYRIDDIDHFTTAEGEEYYLFELESGNREVNLRIEADGSIRQ